MIRKRVLSRWFVVTVLGIWSLTACGRSRETAGAPSPASVKPQEIVVQAVVPQNTTPSPDEMDRARAVLADRLRDLAVPGATVQLRGTNQLAIDLPASADAISITTTLTRRGFLELVDPGNTRLMPRTTIRTSQNPNPIAGSPSESAATSTAGGPIYATIATAVGATAVSLRRVVSSTPITAVVVQLPADPAHAINAFTRSHIGKPMCIVVDNILQSCPIIQSELSGNQIEVLAETPLDATRLAVAVRSGPLPFPLAVVHGPTT